MTNETKEKSQQLKKLDCLVLLTDNLARAEAFYRTLGFDVVRSDEKGIMLKLGSFEIHFHEKDEYALGFRKHFTTNFPPGGKGAGVLIHIEVADARRYYSELVAKGLSPIELPETMPWGNIEFGIKDPDGYILCFYELPRTD